MKNSALIKWLDELYKQECLMQDMGLEESQECERNKMHIEVLKRKVEDSKLKWISVVDDLPPLKTILDKPLSVSGEDIPPLNISINVLRIIQGVVSVGAVEWFDHGWVNATHWQPLPLPPAK